MAAQLFNDGYAELVLPAGKFSSSLGRFAIENVSNPKYMGSFSSDSEYCKNILKINGVPENSIIMEDQSTNTLENAQFSAKVLSMLGIEVRSAIICCQAFHARRSLLSYASCFPDATLYISPAETQGISAANWFKDPQKYKKIFGEVEKCGKYFSQFIYHFGEEGKEDKNENL